MWLKLCQICRATRRLEAESSTSAPEKMWTKGVTWFCAPRGRFLGAKPCCCICYVFALGQKQGNPKVGLPGKWKTRLQPAAIYLSPCKHCTAQHKNRCLRGHRLQVVAQRLTCAQVLVASKRLVSSHSVQLLRKEQTYRRSLSLNCPSPVLAHSPLPPSRHHTRR